MQRSPLSRHLRSLPHRMRAYFRGVIDAHSAYGMLPGYRARHEPQHFDDTANTDDWQREVYIFAADLMAREALASVHDVGCGSGFKLIKYLGQHHTIGFDVPSTVEHLRTQYPDREWKSAPFSARDIPPADMVICSDVIEHVPDPDALLGFVGGLAKRLMVFSTPERNFLYRPGSKYRYGPPSNPSHVREWSADEFSRYIASRFDILHHEITNAVQGTQMILCAKRPTT